MVGQPKTHVLMVTLALQGHMNPMLRLAKRLISKGISVTLATTEVARHRMLSSAASSPINFQFFSDGLSLDFDRHGKTDEFLKALDTNGPKNLSTLIKNLAGAGKTFSGVIINPFTPWAVDVAAGHGLPVAVIWIQASALYAIYYHFFKNPHFFPSLEDPNEAVALPGMPEMAARDIPSFIQQWGPPHFKKLVGEFVGKLEKVRWVLGSSFRELEEEVVAEMAARWCPILPVGPLVSPFLLEMEDRVGGNVDMWSAEDSCMEWLDRKEDCSVIYISFGSIVVLSQKNMDSVATALKNSGKPFLWVTRPADEGAEEQSGELSPEFLEETKDRGLVVTWCPQEKVLKHKTVACFLTHCGWNSALESVVAGVPVITFPKFSDQPTNAKLFVDVFNTGVSLKCGEDGVVSSQDVERCFRELTDGPKSTEFKKKAMEWKEAAKKAVEDGGSSDKNLDQFITEMAKANFI